MTSVGRCPPIPTIEHAAADTTLATPGSVVTYTCQYGYMFPDGAPHHVIECENAEWNHTDIECEGMRRVKNQV